MVAKYTGRAYILNVADIGNTKDNIIITPFAKVR